jgi:hypothetical protein
LLHAALVKRPCSCIRRIAGTRAKEIQFTRFLRNGSVTPTEMAAHAAEGTAARVAGHDVVVIQDTSELVLGGRRARANGYGPVGKGGVLSGLLLHAVVAVEVKTGAVLGLVDAQVRNRTRGKLKSRRSRKTVDKESQRWIDGTTRASEVAAAANSLTGVSDRESDMFEHFAERPANMDLIVRACQNRLIEAEATQTSALLFSFIDSMPEQGRFTAEIPAAPGRKKRQAELAVRFSPVVLRKPLHAVGRGLPKTLTVSIVDVRETSVPTDGKPLHWRLLTTHAVRDLDEARRIVDLYRQRWLIEEFFHTLKTAGFEIEQADIGDPRAMMNFVVAATIAAVTVMQLVKARDGTTRRPLDDAFDAQDRRLLEAICARLEGTTARQKNPHPVGSLAYAAWVLGRLGGWTGYYGKPGPQVMRRGLDDFQRIKFGATLRVHHV